MTLDEHDQRDALITEAAIAMYNPNEPRRCLIEPPFQVESHRYLTMQAADWIAGLVGRFGAAWKAPAEYPEYGIFRTYFEDRFNQKSIRSGIRGSSHLHQAAFSHTTIFLLNRNELGLTGTDAELFEINDATGVVTFVAPPNFEDPGDVGGNNVYDIGEYPKVWGSCGFGRYLELVSDGEAKM